MVDVVHCNGAFLQRDDGSDRNYVVHLRVRVGRLPTTNNGGDLVDRELYSFRDSTSMQLSWYPSHENMSHVERLSVDADWDL